MLSSLTAIGVVLCLSLILTLVPQLFINYYESTDGYQLTSITAWLFFVLINGFYGGAMVMYFSSEITIPFHSRSDVLKAYPTWKLKTQTAMDLLFRGGFVPPGEEDLYAEFLERMYNEPENAVINSIQEGLDLIQQEQSVIYINENQLKSHLMTNPLKDQK